MYVIWCRFTKSHTEEKLQGRLRSHVLIDLLAIHIEMCIVFGSCWCVENENDRGYLYSTVYILKILIPGFIYFCFLLADILLDLYIIYSNELYYIRKYMY